jgi:uncharacterized membrane protein YkvI
MPRIRQESRPLQSVLLMVDFVLTVITMQSIGFVISRLVDYQFPTFGLMTFLILFMGAFFISWPIAVRIAEWVIRRAGSVLETEQSGGARRLSEPPAKFRR